MAETGRPKSRRIFLALWPDSDTRQAMHRVQQQLKQRSHRLKSAAPVAQQNLHLTLHFIGPVSEDVVACMTESLATIRSPSFEMKIHHVGRFPGPKILWLGLQSCPAQLDKLVKLTQHCIASCVEDYEQKPFKPHITLFRKARYDKPAIEFEPIVWRAKSFALIESKTWAEGVEYSVIKEWPLKG